MDALRSWQPVLLEVGALCLALFVGWVAYRLAFRLLTQRLREDPGRLALAIVDEMRPGARLLLPLMAARITVSVLTEMPETLRAPVEHGLLLSAVAAATLLLSGVVGAVAHAVSASHDVGVPDNLSARRVQTQVGILERTLRILIVLIGTGVGLMTFPSVRELGTGLLASAGVVGLVVGFAARPLLENLISGLQLALTQPIRVDDVVIVHGEWGRIEEVTATYVVVKIWDERRLVVPFATFIQQPFENWTRRSADILGSVFLWADYTLPVDEARHALEQIVRDAELWDGRVCNVQVVDTTEHAVKLRALVSASDSTRCWDLRVHVRERWLDWLQRTHPESLPRARILLPEA